MKFDSEARRAARPAIVYDEALPVNVRRAEIAAAIQQHQVIVVCGETGSGKTTQLPKICLELGRGCSGLIGHTQPRRIAARATATRIAQELKSELGRYVGYKIRFTDRTTPSSYIKLMTDGILLAETQTDPLLRQYDTLLIDEAHERSLNIDFLLGYLRQLLPKRPDLKVIVTSATLDAERFSRHFGSVGHPVPVIEVSGRLYPIETRYRPFGEDDGRDLNEAIVDAVGEAHRAGPGDVLVFLPGEREIREAAEALRKHHPPGLEILPLFARQSAQEQSRVFASHQGRRVVLATNVAETSLTVPGIRYVVDSGLARVKRYSHRNKVEQLQVEPVAQAAAKQRAGRCGRVSAGVCFRLYAEDDFDKRPPYTEPEILRSSLAGVILRMKSLHLGDVEDFPFLEAPLPRMITDGYQLLAELGAIDEATKDLTATGRELAKLPLDPKIGRMILAARQEGCLAEMVIIASALAAQDPRERPQEQAAAADQAHAKWKDERSEFLSYLKLWHAADEVWKHESSNKQRQWCRQNFVSWLRLREWRDVHGQLMTLCHEHSWKENQQPASYEAIHRALLAGLLGHIGLKHEAEPHYLGARGIKFFIHPGSTLVKKAGRWIVAAELVETSRLFARCIAKIEPEWLESVGAHLIRRHVYEPHWEKGPGQVVAWERVTLHGLMLHAKRRVHYGPTDPKLAREILIRSALVQGEVGEEWLKKWRFLQHNRKLEREIEHLEHKSRRPDVLVDEDLIHAFYDAKVPAGIFSLAAFDKWRREAEQTEPKLLFLEREQLMRHEAAGITTDAFPPLFEHRGQQWKVAYKHDPGAMDDGVTLALPLAALNQLPAERCEWLVPGLLKEKVVALLKTLPQKYRHRLQPLDAFAAGFCDAAAAPDDPPATTSEPLVRALTGAVEDKLAMKLPLDAFRPGELRPHLLMNFRLLDEHGGTLAISRNLAELRGQYADRVTQAFTQAEVKSPAGASCAGELAGLTGWTFGELPELLEVKLGAGGTANAGSAANMGTANAGSAASMGTAIGFPALVDEGDSVALRAFDTESKAKAMHRKGLARLFALALKEQVKAIEKLPGLRDMALQFMPLGTEKELKEALVAATLERTCLMAPLPATEAEFAARREAARGRILLVAQEIARLIGTLLVEYAGLQKKLSGMQKAFPPTCADIAAQIAALMGRGFITATPFERLQYFPRYLKAAALRLDKVRADPARDARLMAEWQGVARPFERERSQQAKTGVPDPFHEEFRWLLEELRVALFAQELRTPSPVSVKRLQKMWEGRSRG
ncbi:MAG: ATP-dependent RNA helicase HrpA [Gammaproteobacteria bacterium]|nr:ATP-dependent RNA helicase HrpA [Gammaproteobacteria bacterium]MBU1646968.1 ATP-dependent RNA helicase HrpA [Gammaproteobacteria bacterium]MBU1972480.1 ATP-dependent RNA helicase HrpA [Gammaproteobacteria bacterium]